MMENEKVDMNGYRAGYVGVVGMPNSGKSTMVNALVGEKVSIVSARAQTTRHRIQGILTTKKAQYIFVDAPGIVRADKGLNKFLQDEANDVVEKSDILFVVFHIDCDSEKKIDQLVEWAKKITKPWIAVISKTDLPMEHRAALIARKLMDVDVPVVRLSGLKLLSNQRDELLECARKFLPESPMPLYDSEMYTTQSLRALAGEVVREKCFELLQQEIPYGLAVRISKFQEDEVPKIYADIVLNKENHKSIVIGKNGDLIKKIGTLARKDLEAICGGKVFLKLHVVIRKKWIDNKEFMKEMGYVVAH